MKIAEKKAFRASQEKLNTTVQTFNESHGFSIAAEVQLEPVEAYDLGALGKSKEELLNALGNVPSRIIEALGEIVADEDYKEALIEVKEIVFVPAADAKGNEFDYDQSVKLDDAKMTIEYAPLAYMHGGYERSIKNCV